MFYKKDVLRNFAVFTGKHERQCLFSSCNFVKKETLAHGFSSEYFQIFKNTYFTEHLWMATSILQQFLALYFGIIHLVDTFHVLNEKSLVGKKNSSKYFKHFTDLDFFYIDMFFNFLLPRALRLLYL